MKIVKTATLNYSNVFYSFFTNNDSICHDKAVSHFLVYIYSGEMLLVEKGREISVKAGECVFIRRDHRVSFIKHPLGDESFKSISLKFNKDFLRRSYQKLQSQSIPQKTNPLKSSVVLLPKTPNLESLFLSMVPYFESDIEPQDELIEMKMQEGVISLLNIDENFYPTLFDFTEPWKIDILDFLNKNYMYDLTMKEIASYTRRSLATFKRDFKKISDTPPQKWLIQKRLEKAYEMLTRQDKKVTDICFDVGFRNRSHFTTAFKKHYGYAPTNLFT